MSNEYTEFQESSSIKFNQNENKLQEETDQGGFVAYLHSLEKETYSPTSGLDGKARVFLFIKHETIRNWMTRKPISKSEIESATGVDRSNLKKILKALEKDKMVIVHRSKSGKVWNESQYELHPKRFGTNFIYKPDNKPHLVVYSGGKKIIENVLSGVPQTPQPGVPQTPHLGSHRPHENAAIQLPQPVPSRLKNLFKRTSLKEARENVDKSDWVSVKVYLLGKHPGDDFFLEKLYQELKQKGVDDMGRKIGCLPALLFRSYEVLKQNRKELEQYRDKIEETSKLREQESLKPRESNFEAIEEMKKQVPHLFRK